MIVRVAHLRSMQTTVQEYKCESRTSLGKLLVTSSVGISAFVRFKTLHYQESPPYWCISNMSRPWKTTSLYVVQVLHHLFRTQSSTCRGHVHLWHTVEHLRVIYTEERLVGYLVLLRGSRSHKDTCISKPAAGAEFYNCGFSTDAKDCRNLKTAEQFPVNPWTFLREMWEWKDMGMKRAVPKISHMI